MSGDLRTVASVGAGGDPSVPVERDAAVPAPGRRSVTTPASEDSHVAIEIRGLVERGEMDDARDRFSELVAIHQRRASRIAYQYLRDAAEADEAVQDAFATAVER